MNMQLLIIIFSILTVNSGSFHVLPGNPCKVATDTTIQSSRGYGDNGEEGDDSRIDNDENIVPNHDPTPWDNIFDYEEDEIREDDAHLYDDENSVYPNSHELLGKNLEYEEDEIGSDDENDYRPNSENCCNEFIIPTKELDQS